MSKSALGHTYSNSCYGTSYPSESDNTPHGDVEVSTELLAEMKKRLMYGGWDKRQIAGYYGLDEKVVNHLLEDVRRDPGFMISGKKGQYAQ